VNVDLLTIAWFALTAVFFTLLIPGKWRGWFLFFASLFAIYWLQSFTPVRFADFILQTITIMLTVLTWWVTKEDDPGNPSPSRENRLTLVLLFGFVILMAGNRYLEAEWRFTASRPPSPVWVALGLLLAAALFALAWQGLKRINQRHLLTAVILLIAILFVLLKSPSLTTAVAAQWRALTGQNISLASPSDLIWLGFSYVAFRLIHTLRDRQTGQLPALTLREFVTYVIFFPSYIAGPIDRAERFVVDYRREEKTVPGISVISKQLAVNSEKQSKADQLPITNYQLRYWQGGRRIVIGLLKKFVIADTLALGMSLTAVNAEQTTSTFWLWVLLYGYALRLFFDFSGYTDIAIGIGILFGVRLPENFKRPYLTTNITAFWQSWHISLSDWARFYVFSPLSRALLRRKRRISTRWLPNNFIILVSHLSTMIVIGLWHGITFNFFIWGLWHGVALFGHKMWSDHSRQWYRSLSGKPAQKRMWTAVTWLLTFNYVSLGWVWFLLPTPELAIDTLGKLFGVGG